MEKKSNTLNYADINHERLEPDRLWKHDSSQRTPTTKGGDRQFIERLI